VPEDEAREEIFTEQPCGLDPAIPSSCQTCFFR